MKFECAKGHIIVLDEWPRRCVVCGDQSVKPVKGQTFGHIDPTLVSDYVARIPEDPKGALGSQIGGTHYKDMPLQPIEYILANELGFCEGNIVKYITRYKAKGGAEDVKKVIHYAQILLENINCAQILMENINDNN